MIKTRTWILILSILLLLSSIFCLKIYLNNQDRTIANIYQNDNLFYTIDLNSVTEPYEIVIEDAAGKNTVLVEPGRICMKDSDCPDQICIKNGWISGSAIPIVCLPHKIIISLEQKDDIENFDAIAE